MSCKTETRYFCESGDGEFLRVGISDETIRIEISSASGSQDVFLTPEDIDQLVTDLKYAAEEIRQKAGDE